MCFLLVHVIVAYNVRGVEKTTFEPTKISLDVNKICSSALSHLNVRVAMH